MCTLIMILFYKFADLILVTIMTMMLIVAIAGHLVRDVIFLYDILNFFPILIWRASSIKLILNEVFEVNLRSIC